MTFATASKISGICLLALASEVLAAYFLFSNFTYDLVRTEGYTVPEAYRAAPIGPVADVFYVLIGVTAAAAVGAPLVAAVSFLLGRRGPNRVLDEQEASRPAPPAHPGHLRRRPERPDS